MATLAAIITGNFTDAATWGVVDSTALLVSNANSTTLTTSYVLSQTFTPGIITIDGIAVWVNTRPGSTGTISVALDQATVTVVGTEVTINVADIPSAGSCWVFFKFAAPVTLAGATAYSVKAKTSSSSQVSLFRNATAGNWSRLLRTTTTGAPAAADDLYVLGEKTGAGTGNSFTVTMDNTAATVFGLVDINSGGTLAYGTSAATAYLLTLAGNLNIRSGGEFNIGTRSGTAMPSTSSGELAFSNAVNVDRGVEVIGSGIFRSAGAAIANPWALLAADAAASATSLTADRSTGWKNGDLIGIASTTRTASECESKALTADAVGASLTIAALTNAHGGNASTLVQAELINLTRNVKIHGTSATLQAYITVGADSVFEAEATEFFWLGSSTTNKRGINILQTTGSFYAQYCSFYDFLVGNSMILTSGGANNIDFRHNVLHNINAGFSAGTSAVNNTFADLVLIRVSTSAVGFDMHLNSNVADLRVAGVQSGSSISTNGSVAATLDGAWTGTFVAHSGGGPGVNVSSVVGSAFNTFPVLVTWRCNEGLRLGGTQRAITFLGITSFGHSQLSIRVNGGVLQGVTFKDLDVRAGQTLTCPTGMFFESSLVDPRLTGVHFVNGSFGGNSETHATADILFSSSPQLVLADVLLDNVSLNSTTQVSGQDQMPSNGGGKVVNALRANFLGQTLNHKTWAHNGTWSYDTGIADAAPSLRMTPLSATVKLQSPGFFAAVAGGQSLTASVKVRKSVIGDGAAYNGNQPRLIVRRNYGAGITSDTVLDTATAAADGAFETLSGTTAAVGANCALEVFVDCDGTAGWVNVDTIVLVAT